MMTSVVQVNYSLVSTFPVFLTNVTWPNKFVFECFIGNNANSTWGAALLYNQRCYLQLQHTKSKLYTEILQGYLFWCLINHSM
jgi:hypothetical protein